MHVETDAILAAAEKFQSASGKTYAILEGLSETLKELKRDWNDPNQESFLLLYQELEAQMKTSALVLDKIADELRQMSERLEKADS